MAKHQAAKKARLKLPRIQQPTLPRMAKMPQLLKKRPRRKAVRRHYAREFSLREILPVAVALLVFVAAVVAPLEPLYKGIAYGLAALAAGFPVLFRFLKRCFAGRFLAEELMVLAGVVLAFCLGEYAAAALTTILYRIGELAQGYLLAANEASVEAFREILPARARLETDEGSVLTAVERIVPSDMIRVEPNEIFPLDGVILEGQTQVDDAPITGESLPYSRKEGEEVLAGTRNLTGAVLVQVTREYNENMLSFVLEDLEHAERTSTRLEKLGDRISTVFVPVMAAIALLAGLVVPLAGGQWGVWLRRAAIVLLMSSPSVLAISVPLAYAGGVLSAAGHGIYTKSRGMLENLAHTKCMVFSKTGTITEGKYTITEVVPDGVDVRTLLSVAAAAESGSRHPIAQALKQAAGWTDDVKNSVLQVEEIPGRGVSAFIEGRHVYVGNAALMEQHGILYQVPNRAGAAIHVAVENNYWGYIMISDQVRSGAFDALESLRVLGVNNQVMLTGDVLSVSRPMAAALNFDMVKAELSPEGKLSALEYLKDAQGEGAKLAYVGDGINDNAMIQAADLGIGMNALKNSFVLDDADVAIMGNNIQSIPAAVRIAMGADRAARVNLWCFAGIKLLGVLLALTGVLPFAVAGAAEMVLSSFTALYALRVYGLS